MLRLRIDHRQRTFPGRKIIAGVEQRGGVLRQQPGRGGEVWGKNRPDFADQPEVVELDRILLAEQRAVGSILQHNIRYRSRFHSSIEKERTADAQRKRLDRVAGRVERIGRRRSRRLVPVNPSGAVGVGEVKNRVVSLQRTVSADHRAALRPVTVRPREVEFSDGERLAVQPRDEQRPRRPKRRFERGLGVEPQRHRLIGADESRVGMINVIVDIVIETAHSGQPRRHVHILVGERLIDAELRDELLHLPVAFEIERSEELVEVKRAVRTGSGGNSALAAIPFERLQIERGGERRVVPERIDIRLVEVTERNQRRFVLDRDSGIGVHMGEPAGDPPPVMLEHRIHHIEKTFVLLRVDDRFRRTLADFGNLRRRRAEGDVQVGGDVDSPLFECGDEVIEAFQHLGVRIRGVLVVKTDRVNPFRRKTVCQPVGPFVSHHAGAAADVRAEEAHRFAGTVAELEMSAADDHRAIFSGGSVEAIGEIHHRTGFDVANVIKWFPILSGDNVGGNFLHPARRVIADGQRDDSPDG